MNALTTHKTPRGFRRADFEDRFGEKCSIQESSLASEPAIYLGIDKPLPQVLVPGKGFQDMTLPEGAICMGRMHLTQEMAAALAPLLSHFAKTGRLP